MRSGIRILVDVKWRVENFVYCSDGDVEIDPFSVVFKITG